VARNSEAEAKAAPRAMLARAYINLYKANNSHCSIFAWNQLNLLPLTATYQSVHTLTMPCLLRRPGASVG